MELDYTNVLIFNTNLLQFLDATTHLYRGPSAGASVGPSVSYASFCEPRELSRNSIEILEKSRYGSLTANNLEITCDMPAE